MIAVRKRLGRFDFHALPVRGRNARNGRFADTVRTSHFSAGFKTGNNGFCDLTALLPGELAPTPTDPPLCKGL